MYLRGTAALEVPRCVWRYLVKLYLIFFIIDLLVLLAYPVLFIVNQIRRLFRHA